MGIWIGILALVVAATLGLRVWYVHWRQRRIVAKRRVEMPNSHYSSALVRHQVDRQRWGGLKLEHIHPVNREEVERLLNLVDALGVDALSHRERVFLDHLTTLRFG
ncbi:hypothetical protein ACFL5A_03425 [Gemmatimonadota bacterium]